MKLDRRELASVLAGLRCLAYPYVTKPWDIQEIACDGGEIEPLTNEEIDALCERINVDPDTGVSKTAEIDSRALGEAKAWIEGSFLEGKTHEAGFTFLIEGERTSSSKAHSFFSSQRKIIPALAEALTQASEFFEYEFDEFDLLELHSVILGKPEILQVS